MKKIIHWFLILIVVIPLPGGNPHTAAQAVEPASGNFAKLVGEGAVVEKVADGFKFTEGPVFSRLGYLLFSDIPNSTILKYIPKDTTDVFEGGVRASRSGIVRFREQSHGANGLTFDRQGRLLVCESETRPSHTNRKRRNDHRPCRSF